MAANSSSLAILFRTMRVLVLAATTGELLWDYTSGSFWQARGWELRMWLCEAIHYAQYFSVTLFVRQLLLCDMAFIGEYADGDFLTVHLLRREITDPSDSDLQQVTSALRYCNTREAQMSEAEI